MSGDFDNLFEDGFSAPRRSGVLKIQPGGWGFFRQTMNPFSREIYVSPSHIDDFDLKNGDIVTGRVRPPKETEKHPVLSRVEAINGCQVCS